MTTHRVDVSEPAQIDAFAAAAIAAHPTLNILINNAGVALLGQFNEIDQAQFEWLMNINFWGVVHGTRVFLPQLSSRPAAHIVNISSIFGIIAPPGQTAYCASKFAVRGFSEALRHELKLALSPVKLSVVHPGGIATNIVRNMRTGVAVTDNARRAEVDRVLRQGIRQDHGPGSRDGNHRWHREERAPDPDRRRRSHAGSAAAVSAGHVLGGAGERIEKMARRGRGSDGRSLHPPLEGAGRLTWSAAKCEAGWGDSLSTWALLEVERPSPHPAARVVHARRSLAPPGAGK